MAKSVDYYNLLGISLFASDEEIRTAYLKKIKEYHPDTYKGNQKEAENITANLNLAYSILKDKEKKYIYDEEYGFEKLRQEYLKQQEKEQRKSRKKDKKTINPATGEYAYEKQKQNEAENRKKYNKEKPYKDEKIKTDFFTKEPKKTIKKVKRNVLTPEQKSLRTERLILDTVIIALLIIVILLLIFN